MEENTENQNIVSEENTNTTTQEETTPRENTTGTYEKKPRGDKKFSREDGGFKRGKFAGGFKRKKCRFCGKEKKAVDKDLNYKNVELLEKFVSDRGKLLPARITGNCAIHQRKVKVEVKKARYMALLPFARVEKINK